METTFNRIEKGAFKFGNILSIDDLIYFFRSNLTDGTFERGSLDGVKRQLRIVLMGAYHISIEGSPLGLINGHTSVGQKINT